MTVTTSWALRNRTASDRLSTCRSFKESDCRLKKRADSVSSCQLFEYIGRFVSFGVGLLCSGLDFLWGRGQVIDVDKVNQAEFIKQ